MAVTDGVGNVNRRLALAALMVPVQLASAAAAEITLGGAPSKGVYITVVGNLVEGDADTFEAKTAPLSGNVIVLLKSDGGLLLEAMRIGLRIREKAFATFVASDDQCWSGCALAWLAGVPRAMSTTAHIGFHAAYDKDGNPGGLGNAMVGHYITRIGLPTEAVICATMAKPQDMFRLTPEWAEKCGIPVALVPPEPSAPQARPTEPRAVPAESTPLEDQARRFADSILDADRLNDQAALDWFLSRYSDTVKYYGSLSTRQEVIARIRQYYSRWPERGYKLIPESLTVGCNPATSKCVVSGLLDFQARGRDRVTAGRASFVYWLSFAGGANVIEGQDGASLWRSPQQPQTETTPACVAGPRELN